MKQSEVSKSCEVASDDLMLWHVPSTQKYSQLLFRSYSFLILQLSSSENEGLREKT